MVKAITQFTSCIATKAIYLICLAHGLHRVAECVRESHPEIDLLVSTMKKVLIKTSSRRTSFVEIAGLPLPQPVIVR